MRSERAAHGYRRFRRQDCGKQFNERSSELLNRTQYPRDVIALVFVLAIALRAQPERSGGNVRIQGAPIQLRRGSGVGGKTDALLIDNLRRCRGGGSPVR
jgi:hypothetical protein